MEIKCYKLFRKMKNGELKPLFMGKTKATLVGEWLQHEIANGPMALRAGWHASDYPVALHIGEKANPADTKPSYRPANQVWCECLIDGEEITENIPKNGFRDVPAGKFYRFKTNPNMLEWWIIADKLKVVKILSDAEVKQINSARGIHDLPRR